MRAWKYVVPILAVGWKLCTSSCFGGEPMHTTDSIDSIKEKVAKAEAILLDVREQSEWDMGHIDGAVLLPLSKIGDVDQEAVEELLPKNKIIYCHCKSGGRCLIAGKILAKYNYDVRPLKPGFEELVEKGFPAAEDKTDSENETAE